jgi:hypothetical protein
MHIDAKENKNIPDNYVIRKAQITVVYLSNKYWSDCFIQRCAILIINIYFIIYYIKYIIFIILCTIFIVAPTGKTNLVTLESILRFSSKHLNVTGKVAELNTVRPFVTSVYMQNTLFHAYTHITLKMYQNPL